MTLVRALLAVSGAAADNLSVFDPVSPPAHAIRNLFYLILAITGVIFVLTEGMLLYCIVRFGRQSHSDTREPPQIYGSKPIEVAWTVAPLLTVFVLFLVVTRTVFEVRGEHPADMKPLHVTVVGHQWWWEYRYPDLGVTTANELHVEAGRPVVLELESMDVIHSFWVPRLAGKTDVIPGRTNHTWFMAESGEYKGQCAEYCGMQHANMLLIVYADPHDQFEAWLANERKSSVRDPATQDGREVFLANDCASCHTIRGTVAKGTPGPELTHLMSRSTLASGMVLNDPGQLIRWVLDPQTIKPGCLMPKMRLNQRDVDRIVAYLQSLK